MKITEGMKIYDSNKRNGIVKRIHGDEIEVEIEYVTSISFNNNRDKKIQTDYRDRRFHVNDVGTKLFFAPEDCELSYHQIIAKPEYREYTRAILEEKDWQQKKWEDKIKGRVGNLPLLSLEMLKEKQQEYLDKEKSMEVENAYVQTINNLDLDIPVETFFGRMDFKLEHEEMTFYEKIYIGETSISSHDRYYVYDWRAPVCSRYYLKNETSFMHKDSFNGWAFRYDLLLRRAFRFLEGDRIRFENEYVFGDVKYDGITDPFLMDVLTEKSISGKLTDIIKTIQANQNNIIRSNVNDNMIVQGCAGSGKTMILLHRLSYLLFNNKKMKLNSIRIVSPNSIFDTHIHELAKKLELDKIQKGTIEEYYAEKLGLYKVLSSSEEIKNNFRPASEAFDYFYAPEFEMMLNQAFTKWHKEIEADVGQVFKFALLFGVKMTETNSVKDKLLGYKVVIKEIFEKNRAVKKDLLLEYIDLLPELPDLKSSQQSRLYQIISEKMIDPKMARELRSMLGAKQSDHKIKENLKRIDTVLNRTARFCNDGKPLSRKMIPGLIKEDLRTSDIELRQKRSLYRLKLNKAVAFTLAYSDVKEGPKDSAKSADPFEDNLKWPKLEGKILSQEAIDSLEAFSAKMPKDMVFIKQNIYDPLRGERFKSKQLHASDEPFYYRFDLFALLHLAYLYAGPLKKKDTFINIDEGQDVTLFEYRLLNNINGNDVVFNIYGDRNQLINQNRGISDWDELDYKPFNYYVLNENYRNTVQITEYCNEQFGYDTTPVGLNGREVRELECDSNLQERIAVFLTEEGLRKAIIVKDANAASEIFSDTLLNQKFKFNFVLSNDSRIDEKKMNVFIVQMAKGLEFDNVLVIDTEMTKNEKYIALTRALTYVTYCKFSPSNKNL